MFYNYRKDKYILLIVFISFVIDFSCTLRLNSGEQKKSKKKKKKTKDIATVQEHDGSTGDLRVSNFLFICCVCVLIFIYE